MTLKLSENSTIENILLFQVIRIILLQSRRGLQNQNRCFTPCVDFNEYSIQESPSKISPFDGEYVVTIGTAIWAKGTMEVIDMLKGTDISLVHVGGGTPR